MHLLLGNNTAHVIATATANQLALTMRLNEESVGSPFAVSAPRANVAELRRFRSYRKRNAKKDVLGQ